MMFEQVLETGSLQNFTNFSITFSSFRLGTGWSFHTNAGTRPAKTEALNGDEKSIIQKVMERADTLENAEQERIGYGVQMFTFQSFTGLYTIVSSILYMFSLLEVV